jgi:sugar/nucleoside kinase (ribokinase family)
MEPRVVVLGDANVDMVIRLPDRAPGAVDLTGSEPRLFGGGSAANVAVGLARLDLAVTFIGSVGDDGFGRWVADDLAREGVDTRGLIAVRDAFTPMVIALIQPDGERLVVVWPPERGADLRLRPEDLDPDWLSGAAWLHTTGMCLRASPVREAVLGGMALAREAGATVSLDLNLRAELWGLDGETRETLERAIAHSDVVLGSGPEEIVPLAGLDHVEDAALRPLDELGTMQAQDAALRPLDELGTMQAQDAARAICDGRRVVVARLGADGALAAGPPSGEICHAPAFPTSVVDTLGAGDAFDAGFIAARLASCDVGEALRWGNAAAAFKIGRPGARGTPAWDELEGLLGRGSKK